MLVKEIAAPHHQLSLTIQVLNNWSKDHPKYQQEGHATSPPQQGQQADAGTWQVEGD